MLKPLCKTLSIAFDPEPQFERCFNVDDQLRYQTASILRGQNCLVYDELALAPPQWSQDSFLKIHRLTAGDN
jgi:hypothetical protein